MTDTITTIETIEEIGKLEDKGMEIEITWDYSPGEPMVMYDRDGGGYPGSPAYAEPWKIKVLSAWGDGWHRIDRHPAYRHAVPVDPNDMLLQDNGWLSLLQDFAERHVDEHLSRLMENAFEERADQIDSAMESAAEARAEIAHYGRMERYTDPATGQTFDWDK